MSNQPDPTQQYPGYAILTGTFLAGTGAAMATLSRKGRLPGSFAPRDLVLLGVATYQVSRTVSRDRVTTFLRSPFAKQGGSAGRGEVESEAQGEGLKRAVGELLICPICMTQWVGAALLVGLCAAPRTTRFTASLMAVRALAEAIDIGREAAAAKVDKMEDVAKMVARREAATG